jgi:transposase, IS30 family
MARGRRQRWRKVVLHPHLRRHLLQHLQLGWSPQQIAGRLAREHPHGLRLCHETIYRYIYGADGQQEGLSVLLPLARRRRRRRMGRKPRSTSISARHWISNRPPEIEARTSFGHWECDLLIFAAQSGKANVTTLVERQSRFTMLLANDSRHSLPVIGRIRQALETWPSSARQSITFDRGTEFLRHEGLERTLAAGRFFCDPHSPWQKGSVENTNGRIRRYLPSAAPIEDLSPDRLAKLVAGLNATPRKCLGYQTPQEAFSTALTSPEPGSAHDQADRRTSS